jgi:molybdenum cofactor cytidylyltransferase
MIAAIVLAAGESRRMGSPKALLPYPLPDGSETTFLAHLLGIFERSRARPVVVVLGHDPKTIENSVARGAARWVRNERYREGMLSSLLSGLEAIDEAGIEGVLVHPVDHPDVTPELVDGLIASFERTKAAIVLPAHRGRRGHPVLFSRAVFEELRRAPEAVGARQVVWDHQSDLLEVEVPEHGIASDVDTPGDYRAWRERRS